MTNHVRHRGLARPGLAVLLSFATMAVSAHIKNEATQFPDIEYSDARFDIVVLVGAGIIPETPVFEPDKALSKAELATWVALAEGLGRGGETPDTDALAAAAVAAGRVDTLEGNATLADLDRLFFGGELALDDAERTPSKAEAARLIATQLGTDAGRVLLDNRGLASGATGDVVSVEVREGHHGTAYVMTIGATTLQMDEHGRVANGPTDLLQWEGRKVRRSFVRGDGDRARWIYLEAEPPASAVPVSVDAAPVAEPAAPHAAPEAPAPNRDLLYWLIAAAAILGIVLFVSRGKRA